MNARLVVALLVVGAAAATACTRSENPSARDAGVATPPDASSGSPVGAAPDAATPPLVPYVPKDADAYELWRRQNREVADLRDPLRLALAHVPEPHPTWGKLPEKLTGLFPGAERFTVRGYAYRYQGDLISAPGCTRTVDSPSWQEGDMPLADDGSLCPSVGWPGAPLTEEQSGRLVGLIRGLDKNDDERRPMRCGFDPHHAFVFYGERGAPVATLLVCFRCNAWRVFPAQPGLEINPGPRALNMLSALCRELGLGACGHDESTMDRISVERGSWAGHMESQGVFDHGYWAAPGPAEPVLEAASGVDPDKSVADAARSEEDKRRLCAWYIRRPAAMTHATNVIYKLDAGGDAGTTCPDGAPVERRSFAECLRAFPSCPAPVWRAEACVRASAEDPCFTKPATTAACGSLAACNWGTRRSR
jgi:hypothetical protein